MGFEVDVADHALPNDFALQPQHKRSRFSLGLALRSLLHEKQSRGGGLVEAAYVADVIVHGLLGTQMNRQVLLDFEVAASEELRPVDYG